MATPTDFAILAMIQSLLGGSTAQEERFLLNELARRLILSGLAISNTGVFSFTVPFLDASALTGVVGVTHGGTGLATVAVNRILYASATDVIAALPTAASAILQTNGSGVPAWSASLPSGITLTAPVFSGSIGSDLLFTDNTYDIGKTAATRPRDLWLSRNCDVQGTLNVVGATTLKGAVDVGDAAADNIRILGTLGNDLIFTDATYDIGKSAATRPRDGFFSRNMTIGGTIAVTGAATLSSTVFAPKVFTDHCDGRLTLTTALPVTTADVTGATTVYWTPYKGCGISLYDGSTGWTLMSFSETSIALGSLTNDLPYDIFAFNNAGTLNLEMLAWSTKTARATALVLQDGVLVKSGATTRRYLGTFHTTATTTTEDSYAKRLLWNYYNRVDRPFAIFDTTDSWTYDTAAFRQVRATGTNQIVVVVGVAEDRVELYAGHAATHSAAGTSMTAVGYDSTTVPITPAAGQIIIPNTASSVAFAHMSASIRHLPAVGFHTYVWLERAASATTTWYGDGGSAFQTGLVGSIRG